ncbi:MAG TPA: hypothetical protein VGC42_23805 [Kofleriaceae bacterium]
MSMPQQHHHHHHDLTLNDLMIAHHEVVPVRCSYCGRDEADRDFEMVQDALRGRIGALEARVRDLEAMLSGLA